MVRSNSIIIVIIVIILVRIVSFIKKYVISIENNYKLQIKLYYSNFFLSWSFWFCILLDNQKVHI